MRELFPYTRRADGRISVTLDSNVWNFLFEKGIDLAAALPADRFALFIPREVEIEKDAIRQKEALSAYIRESIDRAGVETAATFGFDCGHDPQRYAPMGFGTFQSPLESELHEALAGYRRGKTMGSGLSQNEGDTAVAISSFFSVVLTMERPNKPGPLRFGAEHGGRILHLTQIPDAAERLRDLVIACHERP